MSALNFPFEVAVRRGIEQKIVSPSHNTAAKVRIIIEKTKFLSSEIKEKLVFALMSREKIRLTGQIFEQRNQRKACFCFLLPKGEKSGVAMMSREKIL